MIRSHLTEPPAEGIIINLEKLLKNNSVMGNTSEGHGVLRPKMKSSSYSEYIVLLRSNGGRIEPQVEGGSE